MMRRMLIPVLLAILMLFAACGKTTGDSTAPAQTDHAGTDVVSPESPFDSSESKEIFAMTEKEMDGRFGKALNQTTEADSGLRTVEYQDATVLFGDGYIAKATIRSDKIPPIRGIQIGDTVDDVRAQFPDAGNAPVYPQEDANYNYIVLYGNYVHMSPYGVLHRDGEKAYALELADNDFSVTFNFHDEKLESVTYQMAA